LKVVLTYRTRHRTQTTGEGTQETDRRQERAVSIILNFSFCFLSKSETFENRGNRNTERWKDGKLNYGYRKYRIPVYGKVINRLQ
jgi:hypothetical protein